MTNDVVRAHPLFNMTTPVGWCTYHWCPSVLGWNYITRWIWT